MPVHLKRKRPYGEFDSLAAALATAKLPAAAAPAVSRRATRQSSNPPLPVPQDPEPRRRRRQPDANGEPTGLSQLYHLPQGKENIPVHSEQRRQQLNQQQQQPNHQEQPLKPTRVTRHSAVLESAPRPSNANTGNARRPKQAMGFTITPTASVLPIEPERPMPPRTAGAAPTARRPGRPPAAEAFKPHQQSISVGRSKPIIMATSSAQPVARPTTTTTATGANGEPSDRPARGGTGGNSWGRSDRNIDMVMLGDICFRTWYSSYYGKEVLGDISGNSSSAKGGQQQDGKTNGTTTTTVQGAAKDSDNNNASGAKTSSGGRRGDRDNNPPMLDRLYVCPCCFKYSKELVTWWEHVRVCERRGFVPGQKIYVHPKGKRTVLVPSGQPVPKHGRGKRGGAGQKMVEEVVQDEGEWSIWEVDGETDVLFCQNLSLFAKLFLDNKSVFFDVTGFNYFLLVYTPPAPPPDPNAEVAEIVRPRSQIVGFFSKEKMSWDNNNLACILVFPPWQRKGLGALLIGVSYEISRREGLLGGPEKPISDLGKKGYKRFWAGEIARWLLSLEPSSSSAGETVVDVGECSQATWIAAEDCLLVLREMGVVEDAGKGPPRAARAQEQSKAAEDSGNGNGNGNGNGSGTAAAPEPEVEPVQRVRISQQAVRAWVAANNISLEKACDPNGFVEGYAMKKVVSEEPA